MGVTALGICSTLSIIPQWVLNLLCGLLGAKLVLKLGPWHVGGASVVLVGSVLFAIATYITRKKGRLMMKRGCFQWEQFGGNNLLENPCITLDKLATVQVTEESRLHEI